MPREKESYRDNLERLMDRFPGKEILSFTEVSQYTSRLKRQRGSADSILSACLASQDG